jgi:hypothetical protein
MPVSRSASCDPTFDLVPKKKKGSSVAEFAAQNVHKRLPSEESYQKQEYEAALKRAFLGTDEDFLAGMYVCQIRLSFLHLGTDTTRSCTCGAILRVYRHRCFDHTRSENIRRKSIRLLPSLGPHIYYLPIVPRQTQAIHDPSSVSRVKRTHSVLTTNPQILVRRHCRINLIVLMYHQ